MAAQHAGGKKEAEAHANVPRGTELSAQRTERSARCAAPSAVVPSLSSSRRVSSRPPSATMQRSLGRSNVALGSVGCGARVRVCVCVVLGDVQGRGIARAEEWVEVPYATPGAGGQHAARLHRCRHRRRQHASAAVVVAARPSRAPPALTHTQHAHYSPAEALDHLVAALLGHAQRRQLDDLLERLAVEDDFGWHSCSNRRAPRRRHGGRRAQTQAVPAGSALRKEHPRRAQQAQLASFCAKSACGMGF